MKSRNLLVGVLLLLAATVRANDWPCFRGPNGDGHTEEKITIWPPVELWRANVGQGFSQVVVYQGKVYTFGWANGQNILKCFSEDSAGTDPAPLWVSSYPCAPGNNQGAYIGTYPTPAVSGGRVYTCDNFGLLRCWDANTGSLLWENNAFVGAGPDFAGSPFVEGDLVIINSGSNGIAAAAISTTTHEVVWGTASSGTRYASPFAATIGGQRQIISYGKNVSGLDPATGQVLWYFPWYHAVVPDAAIANPLIIDGTKLFVSQGYNQGCAMVNLGGTGLLTKVWDNKELCTKENGPVYYGGYVYGVSEDINALRCIEPLSGTRMWSSTDSGKSFGTESAVLSAGDQLVIMTGDQSTGNGNLVVVQATPTAYTELYRANGILTGETWVVPTLCNGKLYVRSRNGTLICYKVGEPPAQGYKMKITFSGYDRAETLVNFPALIVLSEDIPGFSYNQFATPGGGDLRFTASDGTTELNYEIDTWNPNGVSYIWVQVPQLTAGTYIWAYWGRPGLTAPPYTTNGATWDSTFVGVWHMSEAVSHGGIQRDSTANHNDAVFIGSAPSACGVPAVIGGGDHIDGAGGLRVADNPSLHVLNHVTMSVWAKSDSPAGWYGELISARPDLALTPHPGNGAQEIMFAAYTGSGRKGCYYTAPDIAQWHYWVGTYDAASGNAYIYCDGYNDPSTTYSPPAGGPMHITNAIPIGDGGDLGLGYNTAAPSSVSHLWLDEVRMENVPRSGDWIWACYMTMAMNNSFQTYGPVEGGGYVPAPGKLQFSSAAYMVPEDGGQVVIKVTRTGGSSGPVSCNYTVAAGTASAGSDFVAGTGTVNFASGQSEATFTVSILDDGLTEADETVILTLSNPTGGASLGEPSTAVITILDEDRPTLQFSSPSYEVSSESSTSAIITVTRTNVTTGAVSVDYSTSDGTATAGVDYLPASGTLYFADGETSKTFTVMIIHDTVHEPDETVNLTLSNPTGGAVLGSPANAVLTIVGPPAPTKFDAWSDRMSITFSGYNRSSVLTNFPALVVLNTGIPGFSYSRFASPTGADLRFSDASGMVELNYEIEKWDPAGSSYVWVQVPQLMAGCTIWAYWGNPNATTAPAYTNNGATWDANFVGVWHMGQPLALDSTANGLNATGAFGNTTAAGLAGDAQSFISASSTHMVVPNSNKLMFGPGDSYVLSAWAYVPSVPSGWHGVVTKSRDIGQHYGIWQLNNSWVYGCEFGLWNGGNVNPGAWNYVAVMQDAGNLSRSIYLNGVLTSSAAGVNPSTVGTGDLWFGGAAGVSEYFDGLLDEVRIEKTARSADWIWACYMTMGANSSFTTYGTVRMSMGAPVITSAPTASGTVGVPFFYQIAATNNPTSYSASGLPAGLSVNASTGFISGVPTAAGTFNVTLGATNAHGTGTMTLALTVGAAAGVDSDGDGLSDAEEIAYGTNPTNPDSDGDGMADGWEVAHNLNPLVNDAAADPDGDGATNLREFLAQTDPQDPASFPARAAGGSGFSCAPSPTVRAGGGASGGSAAATLLLALVAVGSVRRPFGRGQTRKVVRAEGACEGRGAGLLAAALLAGGCGSGSNSSGPPEPPAIQRHWPGFRGPDGQGVLVPGSAPYSWDESSGVGIVWRSPVPLPGASSPVVCGDFVFLTGADATRRDVYCYDANTGVLLWRRAVSSSSSPVQQSAFEGISYAASTVAMDGQRVYALFGNGDLACFDYEGRSVWMKSLGLPKNSYGQCSSPVLCGDLLIVELDEATQWDTAGNRWAYHSRLLALDAKTGALVWEKVARRVNASWTTPIVIDVGGAKQIVTCANPDPEGNPNVISYDAATGAEIWWIEYPASDMVVSPVLANGLVILAGGFTVVAVRPDGTGNVTSTHIAWKFTAQTSDVPCPVAADGLLFLLRSSGALSCLSTSDGSPYWTWDIGQQGTAFFASLCLVGDKVYALRRDGVAVVFRASAAGYEELGRGFLTVGDHYCNASPAFAKERIYIRTGTHLYCIGG